MKRNDAYRMLANMELAIGNGFNRFIMNRGSFTYNRIYTWRRTLKRVGYEPRMDGFTLVYIDPRTKKFYSLDVKEEKSVFRISMRPCSPEINRFWISLPSDSKEHFYGTGETYSTFDLKGVKARIFVAEHQNTNRISRKIVRERVRGTNPDKILRFSQYESYYVQPTVVSSKKYCIHADSVRYMSFNFRHAPRTIMQFQERPSFSLMYGNSYEALSKLLNKELGSYGSLPDWIYDGSILAIQEGSDAVDTRLQKALDTGIKVNGVWSQDWCGCRRTGFGYQVMWNWEADETLYPNLKEKIQEWNAKGVHFLGYINPFMAIEKPLYQYASKHGYCVKDKKGKDYLVTITTFPAAMIDFTNPEAYEWYKGLIKNNMIGIGMSGWMADFGEYLPTDCVLYSGQNPEDMHNQWPAIWARLNKEAIEETNTKDKVFCFMRAGYTGSIKDCGMMWTGDQHVDWSMDDGLPSVIPAMLSLGMSGQTISHSDAGGYTTIMHMTRSKELLMRWIEMNAFSPLLRLHEGNQPSRNVQFDGDDEILKHLAKMTEIHIALKPYLKKLEEEAVNGIPMVRPLLYYYEGFDRTKDKYLLGRDLLVVPILKAGSLKRDVTFPNETWVDLYTGKEYSSGTYSIKAGIGHIPVFYRKHAEMLDKEIIETIREVMKKYD